MKRAGVWAAGGLVAVLIGVLLAWRLMSASHDLQDYVLMFGSAALAVAVLAVLGAVRVHNLIWLAYAYLATPFFANRLLGEVWLGSPDERAAGTMAPFLLGDLVLLVIIVRQRRTMPVWLFLVAALLLAPFASQLFGASLRPDAFAYQYMVLLRALLVAWLAKSALMPAKDGVPRLSAYGLVFHLGVIFGTMGLLSSVAAAVTGQRFGMPGWGTNVYANALCIVGVLCLAAALKYRRRFFILLSLLSLFGIIGSGTRVALVLFLIVAAAMLLVRIVPRPLSLVGVPLLAAGALALLLMFPGTLLGAATELSDRGQTLGGVQLDSSVRLPQLVSALGRESSVRTRFELWRASVDMARAYPVTGVGWGQWNWRKADFGVNFNVLLDPHNGYMWILAEAGLAVFVLAVLGAIALLFRVPRSGMYLPVLLILLLELTNSNLQKSLYAVLAALIIGALFAQRGQRRATPELAVSPDL